MCTGTRKRVVQLVKLAIALAYFALAPITNAMCDCAIDIKKTHNSNDWSSSKLVQVRAGCNDDQLKTECAVTVKRELENFVTSFMEFLDDIYIRPNEDLINKLYTNDKIPIDDYQALRDVLTQQRNAASIAVEMRIHPDCASGLWTETLYMGESQQNTFNDWDRWDLNKIRDNSLCVSRSLEREILKVKYDNTSNRTLTIDESILYASEVNEWLATLLARDSTGKQGLTPYSKRIMEFLMEQRVGGDDIAGLKISTGEKFIQYCLERAIAEPPNVAIPAAELSNQEQFDQGDLGTASGVCFPLSTTVIVKESDSSNFQMRQLGDLNNDDQIVIGAENGKIQTSHIIDFAHRDDNATAWFVNITFYDPTFSLNTCTVSGTSNHNIAFGVYDDKSGTIAHHKESFGKLQQAISDEKSAYIKNARGDWMAVKKAHQDQHQGYVAPITHAGKMIIVPPQLINGESTLKEDQVSELLSSSSEVSCYSTVPDSLASVVQYVQRILIGTNKNVHGAGQNLFFDMITKLVTYGSQLAGHLR